MTDIEKMRRPVRLFKDESLNVPIQFKVSRTESWELTNYAREHGYESVPALIRVALTQMMGENIFRPRCKGRAYIDSEQQRGGDVE